VGGDGNVYEGRGWHQVGAHTYGFNRKGVGIALIGEFSGKYSYEAIRKFI
jgi:N-acetylmuramoyl-L-alanine amidase